MSGALVRRVGVFVGPSYVTGTPGGAADDRIQTGPIDQWLAVESNAARVWASYQWNPPLADFVFDQYGNTIGGGVPVVGAMLAVVHAQAATGTEAEAILVEIENLADVRRYKAAHSTTAWNTIQTWLRGKGLTTIHLTDGGGEGGVEELARRTCAIIEPLFGDFQPGTFG